MSHDIETMQLGSSVEGRPLVATRIASAVAPSKWVLFLAGVHADEVEGIWLLEDALERWSKTLPVTNCGVVVWPTVNPDGVARGTRVNARGVDLNRNLPSKDWTPEVKNPRYPPGPSPASEPENQALVKLIERFSPRAVLSAHSFSKVQVNANGPSREWAEALSKICGYPVTEDIGYPTPGSLGTYAGAERQIPTITLEIERGLSKEAVLALHRPLIDEALRWWESRR